MGIGREVSKTFASVGARVIVTGVAAAPCGQLVDEVEDGSGHSYRAPDLADIAVHVKLVQQARHSLGDAYALSIWLASSAVSPSSRRLRRRIRISWWT